MAKYIKTDGTITDVFPANGDKFTLQEMQTLVGGYIDILPTNHPLFEMCINDEGKLKGLPINNAATSMASEIGMQIDDFIVGDIIIGTKREMGSNDDD